MDASLLLAALIAGGLTVLAPCIFGALPILLGRGAEGYDKARRVIIGLLVSIFVFTFLLKVSTALLSIPTSVWQAISGSIIALVGLSMVRPQLYAKLAARLKLEGAAAQGQQRAMALNSPKGDYLLGASLGPVFSACSPTYALIVAIILPNDLFNGLIYLLAFLAGLGWLLVAIALGGQKLVRRLDWSLDPDGRFKRSVGWLLLALGFLIATGLDRQLLSYLVDKGFYDWQLKLEEAIH